MEKVSFSQYLPVQHRAWTPSLTVSRLFSYIKKIFSSIGHQIGASLPWKTRSVRKGKSTPKVTKIVVNQVVKKEAQKKLSEIKELLLCAQGEKVQVREGVPCFEQLDEWHSIVEQCKTQREVDKLVREMQSTLNQLRETMERASKETDEEFIRQVESDYMLKRRGIDKGPNALFTAIRDFMSLQFTVYKDFEPLDFRSQIVSYMKDHVEDFADQIACHLEMDASLIKLMESEKDFQFEMSKYDSSSELYGALKELFENRNNDDFDYEGAVAYLKGPAGIQLYVNSMEQEGTAGGQVEIFVFHEMQGVSFRIFHPSYPEGYLDIGDSIYSKELFVHLIMTDELHFDLLVK